MDLQLLNLDDVAETLRLDTLKRPRDAVRRLVRTGQLRAVMVAHQYRFRPDDVVTYIEGCPVREGGE